MGGPDAVYSLAVSVKELSRDALSAGLTEREFQTTAGLALHRNSIPVVAQGGAACNVDLAFIRVHLENCHSGGFSYDLKPNLI
jgi:hypothetical protein